uniref:Uncharacterized protein n=1 Tax=Rhizophora mucronata TaxID=61149 RepID=A0A2P2J9C0_RHIMU
MVAASPAWKVLFYYHPTNRKQIYYVLVLRLHQKQIHITISLTKVTTKTPLWIRGKGFKKKKKEKGENGFGGAHKRQPNCLREEGAEGSSRRRRRHLRRVRCRAHRPTRSF